MQAILTKYLPATNSRGSRIKAKCARRSITIPYPHHLHSGDQAHAFCASALVGLFAEEDKRKYPQSDRAKSPWLRPRLCGQLPSGEYVHVFVPSEIVTALNGAEDVLQRVVNTPSIPALPSVLEKDTRTVRGLVAGALKILR